MAGAKRTQTYGTWDVCISTASRTDLNDHHRLREGDIVYIGPPLVGAGTRTIKRQLWFKVFGEEDNRLLSLCASGEGRHKRRYCIPLEDIPGVDAAKARDAGLLYQPFIPVNEYYEFLHHAAAEPFDIHGLLFDKQTGRYV